MEKLNDNELDKVAGGFLFNASGISGSDPQKPWEVIDNNNGNKISCFATKEEAEQEAKKYGSSRANTMEIKWDQVLYLRGQN